MKVTEYFPEKIGEAMRKIRLDRDLSIAELARRTNTDEKTIWGWEAGRHLPSVIVVARLADVLKCSLDDYIGRKVPTGVKGGKYRKRK